MMRYAILARVSTVGQEREGESLEVQEKILTECVQFLGGEVVKVYRGQEHSTTGYERPILESLLVDATNKEFDAVMVFDLSRWSRDPVKSQVGLKILKDNSIRLFIQTQEYNLNSPENEFLLTVLTGANQLTAAIQKRKAILSKIERAKRGWPVGGKPPFGRRLKHNNRGDVAEWELIEEDKTLTEKLYDLYVNQGFHRDRIASMLNMTKSHISHILFDYAGDEWTQTYKTMDFDETIITKVPALLTEEQRAKVKQVAENNRKFNSRKMSYVLSGFLRCGLCSTNYIGMTASRQDKNNSYYTHSRQYRTDVCIKAIRVDLIESAVCYALSKLFGSTDNIRQAIQNALGNTQEKEQSTRETLEHLIAYLQRLEQEKKRLVSALMKGIITEEDASEEIQKNKVETLETKNAIKERIRALKAMSIVVPDNLAELIADYFVKLTNEEGLNISDWSVESKVKIIRWLFGRDKKNGIFIKRNSENKVCFEVIGILGGILLGVVERDIVDTSVSELEELEKTFTSSATSSDFISLINDINATERFDTKCYNS